MTRYHQRGSPLPPHHRSRSFRPSTRPRIREVVNILDALKSEDEGEGENSCHCENTECHCKNAFNESSTDAEPKSDETSKDSRSTARTTTPRRKYRLMRPRWPRCLGGSCRIMRHGPWGGWQQLSSSSIFGHRNAEEQWHEAAGADGSQPRTPETSKTTTETIDDATMGRLRCRPGSSM